VPLPIGFRRPESRAPRGTGVAGGSSMKKGIHPEYSDATITCACGNVIRTRSTVSETHVNTCSSCHPFYTGKAKYIDTEGRVERFRKRYAAASK